MTELPTWLTYAVAIGGPVGAVGGLAGVSALIKARAERQKLSAEADKVKAETDKTDADAAEKLTQIALTLVEPMQREVSRQAGIISQQDTRTLELISRVGQLESDQHTQRMLLVEHSVWDHLALARMKAVGVEDLPPIPPQFPPRTPPAAEVKVEVTTATAEAAT
jgi:hypothetical protein